MDELPAGDRPSYLDRLADLPAESLRMIEISEELGRPLSARQQKTIDKHLKEVCEDIRQQRAKWEAKHGTAPDVPPYGLL